MARRYGKGVLRRSKEQSRRVPNIKIGSRSTLHPINAAGLNDRVIPFSTSME